MNKSKSLRLYFWHTAAFCISMLGTQHLSYNHFASLGLRGFTSLFITPALIWDKTSRSNGSHIFVVLMPSTKTFTCLSEKPGASGSIMVTIDGMRCTSAAVQDLFNFFFGWLSSSSFNWYASDRALLQACCRLEKTSSMNTLLTLDPSRFALRSKAFPVINFTKWRSHFPKRNHCWSWYIFCSGIQLMSPQLTFQQVVSFRSAMMQLLNGNLWANNAWNQQKSCGM